MLLLFVLVASAAARGVRPARGVKSSLAASRGVKSNSVDEEPEGGDQVWIAYNNLPNNLYSGVYRRIEDIKCGADFYWEKINAPGRTHFLVLINRQGKFR